jgi:hypothetical protein
MELSPITVIMGKNNIGKSALLRSPMVAATGINTRSPLPFELARLGGNAPRFVDLIHKRLEVGNITVGLEFADKIGRLELEATIQNMTDWDTQVVSKWALRSAETHAALDWRPPADVVADRVPRSYRFSIDSRSPTTVEVSFEGLLPVAFAQSGQFPESISGHLRRVHDAFDTIRYLSAFRTPPARKLQDLVDGGGAHRPGAQAPGLGQHPVRSSQGRGTGNQRRLVQRAQVYPGHNGEPAPRDQSGEHRGDDPADEDAG